MAEFDVLLVDDDEGILNVFSRRLKSLGYTLQVVGSGQEALDMLKVHRFKVVLTDLMMPGVDGMDVLLFVRNHMPQTDVVMMTGYATVDNAVSAMKMGAVDYLQKPVNLEELQIKLHKLMLLKSLTYSTDELQAAMDVTERAASETIKNLEDMVVRLQNMSMEAIEALLDEDVDIKKRVAHAIHILRNAR